MIKITEVRYEFTFNKGNYQSEKVGVTAAISEGESFLDTMSELKKIVHQFGEGAIEPKVFPTPNEQNTEVLSVNKEEDKESPIQATEEKPKAKAGRKPLVSPEKKEELKKERLKEGLEKAATKVKSKMTVYNRELDLHKRLFGEQLTAIIPDWKKTAMAKAKEASASLNGEEFLDNEGVVTQSFKEKLKAALGV